MSINIKDGDCITFYEDGYKIVHTSDSYFSIINKSDKILRIKQGSNKLLIMKSKRSWFGDFEKFHFNKDPHTDILTYKDYRDDEIKVVKQEKKVEKIEKNKGD